MHRFILIEIAMSYLTFSEKISVLIADITFKLEKQTIKINYLIAVQSFDIHPHHQSARSE